jgi:hypothetical protein
MVGVPVGVGVGEGVGVAVWEGVEDGVGVADGVGVGVGVPDTVGVGVGVGVPVTEGVEVGVGVADGVGVGVGVPVWVGVCVGVPVDVGVGVGVGVAVCEGVEVGVGDADGVGVGVGDPVPEGDREAGDGDGEGLGQLLASPTASSMMGPSSSEPIAAAMEMQPTAESQLRPRVAGSVVYGCTENSRWGLAWSGPGPPGKLCTVTVTKSMVSPNAADGCPSSGYRATRKVPRDSPRGMPTTAKLLRLNTALSGPKLMDTATNSLVNSGLSKPPSSISSWLLMPPSPLQSASPVMQPPVLMPASRNQQQAGPGCGTG